MQSIRKSKQAAVDLGGELRLKRKMLNLTLEEIAIRLQINVGQLSRFERGEFKFISSNLQKVLSFLQEQEATKMEEPELVTRFANLVARSPRHRNAAGALVSALETLE